MYPDASGSARKTSAAHTDHDIMKMAGFQVLSPRANPPVKDRVNTVNRLLREGRLTVDSSCKYTIMDLEQNVWRNQQIDTRDPEQGHMLDALGYGCNWLMPIVPKTVGYSSW